jgi:hypothetical protein
VRRRSDEGGAQAGRGERYEAWDWNKEVVKGIRTLVFESRGRADWDGVTQITLLDTALKAAVEWRALYITSESIICIIDRYLIKLSPGDY